MAGRRASHRRQTARRINTCAQLLTEERGLDGFSMDDLADAAGVSRRTLFNYFPGKDAAVLGDPLVLDPTLVSRFVAGGPTGRLVDDMVALIEPALANESFTRDEVARARRVLAAEPRLMTAAHERFTRPRRAGRRAGGGPRRGRPRPGPSHDRDPRPGRALRHRTDVLHHRSTA